jgi:hypothetical protein
MPRSRAMQLRDAWTSLPERPSGKGPGVMEMASVVGSTPKLNDEKQVPGTGK